jgi:twitching motility protein PilT
VGEIALLARIDVLLKAARDMGASDLHLQAGYAPSLRLHGEIRPLDFQQLSAQQVRELGLEMMNDSQVEIFERRHDIDFSYEVQGELRCRVNAFEQHHGASLCVRLLPSDIVPLEQLGIPLATLRFTELSRGLVVVTGPPGSGKSSTLAALIDHVNSTQKKHVLTLEDPIEYVHENKQSIINQREVGRHVESFASGLRAALREDPDIILVGEMRDAETIGLALLAAEVGQLVFGTLHTASAAQTVNRILDAFPSTEQDQVRSVLADTLQGVVAQRLLKGTDGRGRVAATEILFATPAIGSLIRDKKTAQIVNTMQTGKKEGMQLMDDSIQRLASEGRIDAEVAAAFGLGPHRESVTPNGWVR